MFKITIDINECREGTDGCAQICTDSEGSYSCSCETGYNLAEDKHGCNGKNTCSAISCMQMLDSVSIRYK